MDRIGLILLAGGSSLRFSKKKLKQLLPVCGLPLYLYTLSRLQKAYRFYDVVVVLNPSINAPSGLKTALPGKSWMESVYSGFSFLSSEVDKVLVHDAARPFFDASDLLNLIEQSPSTRVASLGSKERNTLARIEENTIDIIDRTHVWEIFTPQIANREIFLLPISSTSTDLITHALSHGVQGKIFPSNPLNIKITYPQDVASCETLSKAF